MDLVKNRAERERTAHNEGLERAGYERIFDHALYLYSRKTAALIADAMRARETGRFLEIGSTSWLDWLEPARIVPASLTCINISEVELAKGVGASADTANKPRFVLMDANNLKFPDKSFDVVYGGSILHHLDFERSLLGIRRVLKPGGLMLFREPLDFNPVARFVRAVTPKARTVDEQPLRAMELRTCRELFDCTFHFEQFLSVPAGVLSWMMFKKPNNVITRGAFAIDEWILKAAPMLGPLYRVVVISGMKR